MLSLLHSVADPSISITDAFLYVNSINYSQSLSNDLKENNVEKIKELLLSPKDRLYGSSVLSVSLKQNAETCVKVNWSVALIEIIKDPGSSYILKEHACDILSQLIPYISKDASASYEKFHRSFTKDVFPFLLGEINKNALWTKGALLCVLSYVKSCPVNLLQQKENILQTLLKKVSLTVSSEIIEIVANCFCELPNVIEVLNPNLYASEWKNQYKVVLNTLWQALHPFITFMSDGPCSDSSLMSDGYFEFCDSENDKDDDASSSNSVLKVYLRGACRYINLSKCLAKMLSSRSRFCVEIPMKRTLNYILQLFKVPELKKIKATSTESQIICSLLSQMQVASLVVLESLILNFSMLQYSRVIATLFHSALVISKLSNISANTVCQIRHAVWKLMKIFICKHGGKVSCVFIRLREIIPELLEDIITDKKKEADANETSAKSEKKVSNSGSRKFALPSEEHRKVCKEALQTLHQLICTGSPFFVEQEFMEIFSKVLGIAKAFRKDYNSFPFPYDDESVRKKLYSVLLALTMVSSLEQNELTHTAVGVFKNAFRDPSYEVSGFCNVAMANINTKLYPKRPPQKGRFFVDKQRSSKVSSVNVTCHEWSSDEFVQNIMVKNASKAHENTSMAQTFHDPSTSSVHHDEIDEDMVVEPQYSECYASDCYVPKYSEQPVDNKQNVKKIQELKQSNPCQEVDSDEDEDEDEEEDDEEEDDEEEEDDDERNYEEDERNYEVDERNYDEEVQAVEPEDMYIPTTSKLQVLTPVHISPETVPPNVADREYNELRPCARTESIIDSIENIHLNGEHNIVPDGDGPSSSTEPSLANENGVVYDDEMEDEGNEDDDDEEEEEEERGSFPAEKRVPSFQAANPPTKRQRLESDEPQVEVVQEVEKDEMPPASPTLAQMKADFVCSEIKDVTS